MEAQLYAGAEDEAAAERARAELWAPPRGERVQARAEGRPGPTGRGVSMAEVQAMMGAVAQQDAQLTGGRSS
ncbi:hypothetical protein OG234_13135 [Streptomyces sp. NBC_01420]|uniref:hypothetical protein n=1 Tax=Streptomyces sp. NBC_01420 TaxID=2903858 RepID=UPI0032453DC8